MENILFCWPSLIYSKEQSYLFYLLSMCKFFQHGQKYKKFCYYLWPGKSYFLSTDKFGKIVFEDIFEGAVIVISSPPSFKELEGRARFFIEKSKISHSLLIR